MAVLGLAVVHFANKSYDDVFISLRYAENLAAGRGLVFNPGERVEGYSNFAWTVLLAVPAWLGAAKSDLARRIVADFHSEPDADRAAAAFEARFSRGELQIDDLPVLTIDIEDESVGLAKLLSLAGLASSASDATRKIQQGGARVNREKVSDPRMRIAPAADALVIEVGRKAVRVIVRRPS